MKFTISAQDFSRALGRVIGVIPTKSTRAILEHVLLDATKSQLIITGTDEQITVSDTIDVKVSSPGRIAVPARKLFETLRAQPAVELTFNAALDTGRITISTPSAEYKLTGLNADQYITPAPVGTGVEVSLPAATVRGMIEHTLFAVSMDQYRPAMTGVLFELGDKQLRAVATDGIRLVKITNNTVGTTGEAKKIIVPAKALNLILRSLDGDVYTMKLDEQSIMFSAGGTTVISRLINESYPNYEGVIPIGNEKRVNVERLPLSESIRRVGLFANPTTSQVRFSMKEGSMTLATEDFDSQNEAKETLSCDYAHDALEIGFNWRFLNDALSHMSGEMVTMELSGPTRAMVMRPVTTTDGEDMLMLVMPMRLNS